MIICNLFFIFDPSLRIFSRSWLVLFFFIFLPSFFFLSRRTSFYYLTLFNTLSKEISFRLSKTIKGFNHFLISLFTLILIYNFLALFPHIFSSSSHLLVTLPLAYTLWLSIILFNLLNYFKFFTTHFIPLGTPVFLISFIVVVEVLRNLIRPLALTFRLTANIIAGHLLISLICSIIISLQFLVSFFGVLIQALLVLIEMGVSFIQAYVFFTLLLLYASETEGH